jgi:hypothetical protein
VLIINLFEQGEFRSRKLDKRNVQLKLGCDKLLKLKGGMAMAIEPYGISQQLAVHPTDQFIAKGRRQRAGGRRERTAARLFQPIDSS